MTSCKPPPTCIDASPTPDANDSRMSAIPYEANLRPMGLYPLRFTCKRANAPRPRPRGTGAERSSAGPGAGRTRLGHVAGQGTCTPSYQVSMIGTYRDEEGRAGPRRRTLRSPAMGSPHRDMVLELGERDCPDAQDADRVCGSLGEIDHPAMSVGTPVVDAHHH